MGNKSLGRKSCRFWAKMSTELANPAEEAGETLQEQKK